MRAGLVLLLAASLWAGSAAAAPRPLPDTTSARDRAAWRLILRWPPSCERAWRDSHAQGAGIAGVWTLPGGRRLVAVDCTLAAYQGTSVLYLLDAARHPRGPLAFEIYRDSGSGRPVLRRTSLLLGTLAFSGHTNALTVLDKFRGLGDCGIYSVFRLVGDEFVRSATRAKLACDGKGPYDPRRWPLLR